ncbi:MAG TPA: Asd/ArgC dimerization domain-containing protein [Bryobacteraceae bacterium]|nr:Asd/ArgC dimerization domain-containing protein [Bryobacteraceae bacterium]
MAKAQQKTKALSVALIGAETLLGRELEEVIKDRVQDALVHPFSASGEGNFGEEEGEPIFVEPFTAEVLSKNSAVVIAGSREGATKAYDLAQATNSKPITIDCTGYLEEKPETRILSPLGELFSLQQGWLYEIAHPAASALVLVLARLGGYQDIKQVIVHIFEPASERGHRGVSELQKQTTNLLSFKPLDKTVFDSQVSFNMLAQYGEEAPVKLASIEQRIIRHLTTLLSRQPKTAAIPNASVRLVQAPVFHGYSMSVWVQFENTVNATEAGEALASAQIEVRRAQDTAPDNVGVASQSGLIVGDIRVDENNPRAMWFWIVGDNLRLTADAVSDAISSLKAEQR